MNYYPHNIGDFLRDTTHLSFAEEGCYRRLLDVYYSREEPLPEEKVACYRMARAVTKSDREIVDRILGEFFELVEGSGYHQKRADQEIERYKDRGDSARRSAEARWRRAKPDANAHANAYANASQTHMRPQCVRDANPESRIQNVKGARASSSTRRAPDPPTHGPDGPAAAAGPPDRERVENALRGAGVNGRQLTELANTPGLTPEAVYEAEALAAAAAAKNPAGWLVNRLRNHIGKDGTFRPPPGPETPQQRADRVFGKAVQA